MTATMLSFSSVIVFVLIEVTHVYICSNTCTVLILFPSKQCQHYLTFDFSCHGQVIRVTHFSGVLFTMLYISKLGFYSLVGLIALVIILFSCCIFHNWGSYPLVGLMPFSYYFNSKLIAVLVIYFSTLLHSQTWS